MGVFGAANDGRAHIKYAIQAHHVLILHVLCACDGEGRRGRVWAWAAGTETVAALAVLVGGIGGIVGVGGRAVVGDRDGMAEGGRDRRGMGSI